MYTVFCPLLQLEILAHFLLPAVLYRLIKTSRGVNFWTIQFSISSQSSFIRPIDKTLSGATTSGQSGPGSNSNERVLWIPQSSNIIGTPPSDCFVSYPGHSLGRSYPSAKMQLVYSTSPANWANEIAENVWYADYNTVNWHVDDCY